jgi:hypothetical protein
MFQLVLWSLFAASLACAQNAKGADLKALYDAQKWADLHDELQKTNAHNFYRGAVAVVFHEDPRKAESFLRSVIKAEPRSEEAWQAYEWLSHLFLYGGQYRSFVSIMEARWNAFPQRPGQEQEREEVAGFRGLPDQVTERVRPSTLQHEDKSIFIPLSVNGSPATWFFDTGAWVSAVSESEAKRLGLKFGDAAGAMATITNKTGFRTAVAEELIVGDAHLRNVSFAVFPDDGEPWSSLPPGRRGLLGMPVIVAFRTLRWASDGTVRIGENPEKLDMHKANLIFDNDHLAVRVAFQGRNALASVDTGAEGTDLFREFALQFPSVMESGRKGSTEISGIGGKEFYESVTLPEVKFELGGIQAVLSSPHVLMNRSLRSYVGNLGLDVFEQGRAFKLDFTAMRLELGAGDLPGRL